MNQNKGSAATGSGIELRVAGPKSPFPDGAVTQIHTDQQLYRELCLNHSRSGNSADPSVELAALQAKIGFCLRKLQRYVESGKILQKDLDRWRRRSRIAGSVKVWDEVAMTHQATTYVIKSECSSTSDDSDCPLFDPVTKNVAAIDVRASMQEEVNRGIRWSCSILNDLADKLDMELERVEWIREEFGPVNTAKRDASERLTGA